MRYLLNTIHPNLERAINVTNAGLLLFTRNITAARIRAGKSRTIARFLDSKDVRNPDILADIAYFAALVRPDLRLPAEGTAVSSVREVIEEAPTCRTPVAAIERKLV